MYCYTLKYIETYEETYTIIANSQEEAEEILLSGIRNGIVDGPEICIDSGIKECSVNYNDIIIN